jgi:hypothetical protein
MLSECYFFVFLFFGGGVFRFLWYYGLTQGLMLARPVLYHLSHVPGPFV